MVSPFTSSGLMAQPVQGLLRATQRKSGPMHLQIEGALATTYKHLGFISLPLGHTGVMEFPQSDGTPWVTYNCSESGVQQGECLELRMLYHAWSWMIGS